VFLSSVALWSGCCSIVEGPEFDSKIVCEGGERLTSWKCEGVNMCIGRACGSICWFVRRTREEKQGLCIVLLRRNIQELSRSKS
jgi:hypothetical protein